MRIASPRRHPGLLALGLLASTLASSCAAPGSVPPEPRPVPGPMATAPGSAIPSWSSSEASAFDWQTLGAIEAWLSSLDASRMEHFRSEARLKLGTGLMGIDPTAAETVRADRWERAAEQFSLVQEDPKASRDQLDRAGELLAIAQRGPRGARSASAPPTAGAIAPLPGFIAKLAFGEMAEDLLLGGQRVRPDALLDSGFRFTWPEVEGALRHALGRELPQPVGAHA